MADAENSLHHSKKRTAGVQLTRDNNGLDDDVEDFSNQQETGTFRKASDEVLATRRIVKVRRHQTPSAAPSPAPTSSSSNPFSGIRLAPVSSTTPVEPDASKEVVNNNDGKSEAKVDEATVESAPEEKIATNEDNIVQSGAENTASSSEKNEPNEKNTTETEGNASNEKKTEETAVPEAVTGEEGDQKGDDKEKNNTDEATEKGGETVPVSSFGQLSSTQNAFSGLSGGGFPSAPFSSGSSTGSLFGLKTENPIFGFGTSNNGSSSIFGGTNILTEGSSSSKNPPMQEVPVETGEEEEATVFAAGSILFEYVDGSWKERGKGEVKVNVPSMGTGKSRLVMRTKGNLRLILNANLFPDMKMTAMDKKGVTFACVNSASSSEGKKGLSTVALKFRDSSVVEDFRAVVAKHKEEMNVGTKTAPEGSPKAEEV